MSHINFITRNSTIDEWRIQTNLLANVVNRLESQDFEKSNGDLILSGNTRLIVTSNPNPCVIVANNVSFSSNLSVGGTLTTNTINAQRLTLSDNLIANNITSNNFLRANILVISSNTIIADNTLTTNNIIASNNLTTSVIVANNSLTTNNIVANNITSNIELVASNATITILTVSSNISTSNITVSNQTTTKNLIVSNISSNGITTNISLTANNFNITGNTKSTSYYETKADISGSVIDLSKANYFAKTISSPTTFSVINVPPSGTVASFILDITNGASYSVNWWSGLQWPSGIVPTLTTSGRDVLGFFTHDGGVTWSGFILGKNVQAP